MNSDALGRLAFSLSETEGTYAVLLGSGISSAAGILTGWGIAMDLIRKMAISIEEEAPDDLEDWYRRKFGKPVNYSDIVEWFGGTQAERTRLLSGYIEPDDDDIREGRKKPTPAHRAIAKLAKHGCIRVIVTTNIDHLMELALADENVHPIVVSSVDDIEGMVPLSQAQKECIVFKVHGDYKDIRSLHTEEELKRYPKRIDDLLDQIFREFGMVVCGWSAQWDFALCGAIKRCDAELYSWFWAARGAPGVAAAELIDHRQAEVISIEDADGFFNGLRRRVERLKGVESQDLEPVKQGVALLQSYLHQHLGPGIAEIGGDLSAVVSQIVGLSSTTASEQPANEDETELSKAVYFARQLVGRGLVVQAQNEINKIRTNWDAIPDDVEVRIATVLAACAMADEDIEGAAYWSNEAHRLRPGNPAVIGNAALAAQRSGDSDRALKLAEKARELNATEAASACVTMVEMWRSDQSEALDEFVSTENWVKDDPQCSLVLATIRLQQGEFAEAVALCRGQVSADDQDAQAQLALAQALMNSAQADRLEIGYSAEDAEKLKEVISEATKAIDLLSHTELRSQRHAGLVLRGCARAIVGMNVDAMADFDEALQERPGSSEATFYKGMLHLTDGRPNEAAEWFQRVQDTSQLPETVVPVAHALLSSGDVLGAIGILRGSFDLSSGEWEDIHRAELLLRAEEQGGETSTIVPALQLALEHTPTDAGLLALLAEVRNSEGDLDRAEEALICALEVVDPGRRSEILLRLGYLYQDCGRFSEAADRFREVVGDNALHPLAVPLLVCLYNGKQLRKALALSREMQRLVPGAPRIVADVEFNIVQLAGDVPAIVSCLESLCAHPESTVVDQIELALAQVRAADFEAARQTVRGIDPNALAEDPVSLLQSAKIKRVLGENDYLNDAYLARRSGMGKAEAHLGYFALFVGKENELIEPSAVGAGCAVRLKGDDGGQWWSILDDGEARLGDHELELTSDLAAALVDKQVGETVVLRQGFEDLRYEVVGIQSKFVRAFQEIAAEFSTRFPNNTEMSRVAVDVDDPSRFLQIVDQRDKFVREVEQLYREGIIPLVTFASHIGKFPFEVWLACTQHEFTRIQFRTGTAEDTNRAAVLLEDADSIVLDMVALFTVHELGIIELLRERFERVTLPQVVFDDLQNLAFEARTLAQKSGFIGRANDGSYTISDVPEGGWTWWQERVEAVLDFARTLELVPSYGLLDGDNVELVPTLTPAGAGAVWTGGEDADNVPLLVSDDLALSKIAAALGVAGVNTQDLLLDSYRSGRLGDAEYTAFVERLATMNYWYVQVRSGDIINSFERNGYVTGAGTRGMFRTVEGPECAEDAAVNVMVDVVVGLLSRTVPGQFDIILALVLSTLQKGRETSRVLLKFEQAVHKDGRLSSAARQRILESIVAYKVGGMTRSGSGLIVVRY